MVDTNIDVGVTWDICGTKAELREPEVRDTGTEMGLFPGAVGAQAHYS